MYETQKYKVKLKSSINKTSTTYCPWNSSAQLQLQLQLHTATATATATVTATVTHSYSYTQLQLQYLLYVSTAMCAVSQSVSQSVDD